MVKLHFNSFSNDVEDGLSATVYFPRCNLRCRYCYNFKALIYEEDSLTIDQVKEQISKLKVNGMCRVDYIVFSGGECTLYFRELKELICYAKSLGFKTAIYTNGIQNFPVLHRLFNSDEGNLVDFVSLDFKIWSSSQPSLIGFTPKSYLKELEKTVTLVSKFSNYSLRTVLCKKSTSLDSKTYFEDFKKLINNTAKDPQSLHISNVIINKDNYSFTEEDSLYESVSEEELENFVKNVKQSMDLNKISTKVCKHQLSN